MRALRIRPREREERPRGRFHVQLTEPVRFDGTGPVPSPIKSLLRFKPFISPYFSLSCLFLSFVLSPLFFLLPRNRWEGAVAGGFRCGGRHAFTAAPPHRKAESVRFFKKISLSPQLFFIFALHLIFKSLKTIIVYKHLKMDLVQHKS